jgi:cell division protein FtsW (lipid II flippase)
MPLYEHPLTETTIPLVSAGSSSFSSIFTAQQ